jgi:hypothetical protein
MYESEFEQYTQTIDRIKQKEQEVLKAAMEKDFFNAVITALIMQL